MDIIDDDGDILGRNKDIRWEIEDEFLDELDKSPLDNVYVPRDPNEFLADFGGLYHPWKKRADGFPEIVSELTQYQLDAWGERNTIMVSSNKVGKTTSFSLEDFQSRLFPQHAGRDLILVAQNQRIANEHLLDLKKLVRSSEKYRRFLIERPDREMFKEEKSKLATMYIRNPFNYRKPSRIMALGGSEASAFSWKNVDWIHMSDVSQLPLNNQKLFFGALFSRLANTNGIAKIETIPSGKAGEVWRIWNACYFGQSMEQTEDLAEDEYDFSSTFKPVKVTIYDAVEAGLVQMDYVNKMKAILDEYTFRQLFMAEFVEVENAWYNESMFGVGNYGAD